MLGWFRRKKHPKPKEYERRIAVLETTVDNLQLAVKRRQRSDGCGVTVTRELVDSRLKECFVLMAPHLRVTIVDAICRGLREGEEHG